MTESQSSLFDFERRASKPSETPNGSDRGDDELVAVNPKSVLWTIKYDRPSDKLSCPWCLCPSWLFHTRNERVSCSHCEAQIPTEMDWYRSGDKICLE